MSNTNNNLQTQTSNALYNAIMEASGKDRPPMFRHDIHLTNSKWMRRGVPVAEGSFKTTIEGYMENYKNVSQDIRNQLDAEAEAEFGKFTSRDGESLESYYSRFYKMMNELVKNQYDVTNHQVNVQFLLQLQPEWQSEKEIDKLMALISLSFKKIYKPTNNNPRTLLNTSRANQDNTPRINKGTRHVTWECQKPKRAKDATYHKEKMLLCKQEEVGFHLNAEQADWRDDTDDEPDDQELEAHYMYMAHIQEVTLDAADNYGPIFDTEPLQKVHNDDDNYNVFANDREIMAT
ncbi:hypothetical protein Tco_1399921 [Tanacetum coccineum]